MKFQFPKDEELFGDVPKRKKMSIKEAEEAFFGIWPGLNGAWSEKIRLQIKKEDEEGGFHAEAYEWSDVLRRLDNKVKARDVEMYRAVERVVDEYADKKEFDCFPSSFITHRTYVDKNDIVVKDYKLDYFEEQAKHFGFMNGYGRVGSFIGRVGIKEKTVTGKDESFVPVVAFLLGFTAFLLLCIGGYLPYVPDFLTDLMSAEWGFFARLPVVIILAIGCCCLLLVDSEEIGGLVGFVANGLFRMIVAIGSVLSGLKIMMESGYPLEIIYFLPYIAYFVLLTLSFMLQALFSLPKRMKMKKQAKKEMLADIEKNIEHMHRYIRFHVLWWEALNGKKALPKGIINLQKSFDHTLELYKKYH